MKTCYVSIPYGIKAGPHGLPIDFDRFYLEVVRPAVEAEGVEVLHGTDLSGAIYHKALFRTILSADIFIADITTGSPNVMYELGLRHATRRNVTLLIMAEGTQVPFNVNLARVLTYVAPADGEPSHFFNALAERVREGLGHISNDSPIYDFFPDLVVELPDDIASAAQRRVQSLRSGSMSGTSRSGVGAQMSILSGGIAQLREDEQALREIPEADPFQYLALMRNYRDQSAWDELVRVAETLPAELKREPEVLQMLALALNRRHRPGDQDRAISLLESLIAETGGDAESFGVLGRIYKDRWFTQRDADPVPGEANLDRAIDAYRNGFEREPSNYYAGINLATLLRMRGKDTDVAELTSLVPRVRSGLNSKTTSGREDYWENATRLELEVLAGEWGQAEALAGSLAASADTPWMLESTRAQLKRLQSTISSAQERVHLSKVINRLSVETGSTSHV